MGLWYTATRYDNDKMKWEFAFVKASPPNASATVIDGNDPSGDVYDGNDI